jgi:hypothetical protein
VFPKYHPLLFRSWPGGRRNEVRGIARIVERNENPVLERKRLVLTSSNQFYFVILIFVFHLFQSQEEKDLSDLHERGFGLRGKYKFKAKTFF